MAHTWTWEKLANNSYRLNPKSRGPKYPYTPKWETIEFTSGQNKGQNVIVPYVGTKTLLISLRAWGVTQSALHAVTLLFHDVDIQTTNPNDRNYFQIQYNGQMYWIHKLDRRRNPLTARCSCKDFIFTWAWYNYYNAHCLYGPPPKPYKKKTNRKPRNPHGMPGICKHVYNAWAYLRNSGLTMD